jgi:hypothetical protein
MEHIFKILSPVIYYVICSQLLYKLFIIYTYRCCYIFTSLSLMVMIIDSFLSCPKSLENISPRNNLIQHGVYLFFLVWCRIEDTKVLKVCEERKLNLARTVATCSSAITRRSCSTERTPPAPPYPTNPATLLFHSLYRKSIAFSRAPGIPWLYSAVTNTNASKEWIFADQALV